MYKTREYIKVIIPEQLKTNEFKFIKLVRETKLPLEKDWQDILKKQKGWIETLQKLEFESILIASLTLLKDRANRSLILSIIPEHIGWIEQLGLIEGYLKCKGGE